MECDLLIVDCKAIVQVRESTPLFVSGSQMDVLPILENSYLIVKDGNIFSFGAMKDLPKVKAKNIISGKDKFLFPSFIDSHTHLVFASSRESEFVMKIKGASYEEIATKGGGILQSTKKLQSLSEDELIECTLPRVNEIIASGTGAVEIKSGYGLTVKDELKMLRVARRIGKHTPLKVKTTFLGAHAVPINMTKEKYINMVMEEMIPAVAEENLADYIDVFCETGFFSAKEATKILLHGKKYNLIPRLHANQLNRSGGVQVGIEVGAKSIDHLENIGDEEIEILKGVSVMPTVLPCAAFFLNLPFPPARKMIDSGLPIAIASDYNPGSSPSGNMPLMISLACIGMKITPKEAFNATTINTAWALDILDSYGSITVGKVANFFITKSIPSIDYMPYKIGSSLIETVILNGKIVVCNEKS